MKIRYAVSYMILKIVDNNQRLKLNSDRHAPSEFHPVNNTVEKNGDF
jgi:hypothetical protein